MFDPVETISVANTTSLTQVQRIVAHMFDHPERVWWFAGDFMQPRLMNTHKHYVGYEASARLTDAITRFNQTGQPQLFKIAKKEKFRMVRVDWDSFRECLKTYLELIRIAETTQILSRFEGLKVEVEDWKPEPPKPKTSFKSY